MMLTRSVPVLLLAACLCAGTALAQKAAPAAPKPPTNDDCLACHGDASAQGANGRSVAVLPDKFGASVHGLSGLACVDCHADLATSAEFPHAEKLAPVSCAGCHDAAVAKYDVGVHAEARRDNAQSVAAACRDCHGTHEIRASKDPESLTYHLNLPATCGRCHGNAEIIRKGRIAVGDVVAQFQDSIHGQALSKSGLAGRARLQGLSRRARHQAPDRPGEPRVPDDGAGHVRQVPRGRGAQVPGGRARRRAGQGAAGRADRA